MALLTTTIGAYPKPSYVETADWFGFGSTMGPEATLATNEAEAESDAVLDRAVHEVVTAQVAAGIDVPADGEVRRENYVHYHCRHLDGIDFTRLTTRVLRNGAWEGEVPTFVSEIAPRDHFLPRDWRVAQAATDRPVKITMPGPMTIMDTTADAFYGDELTWGAALADALNHEARALAAAGCTVIQVDEPVFARYPDRAVTYGIELLERVFDGLDPSVTRAMHVCCGYPDALDSDWYEKADVDAYQQIAPAIDAATVKVVSIEDAHRYNDPSLFEKFSATTVVLGAVQIARSRVESVEEISERVSTVLDHIDADRLMLGPDCGLGMLPEELVTAKLENMTEAARSLG